MTAVPVSGDWLACGSKRTAGRVPAPGGGAKAQGRAVSRRACSGVADQFARCLFRSISAPVSGEAVDLGFIDPIAEIFAS